MIELPNKKKCYNLPEQVAQNLLNIQYLAEQYKNIDALPTIWQTYKEEFDNELETFGEWTTTFEGWTESLSTYLANMSSAAVGAIAGQNIAPANVAATGNITAPSIIENMSGYSYTNTVVTNVTKTPIYVGAVKNGNKLTLVVFIKINKTVDYTSAYLSLGEFNIPNEVSARLYPTLINGVNLLDARTLPAIVSAEANVTIKGYLVKGSGKIYFETHGINNLVAGTDYFIRYEVTFLLSDNLAS